jgi:uncharacterized membrane protein YdbT with pleckstrin-like domain
MPDIFVSPDAERDDNRPEPIRRFINNIGLRRTRNPLSPVIPFPDDVEFETQDQKEEIVLLLRRHPITNVPWICLALLMIIVPLFLRIIPLLASFPPRFRTIIIIIWYLIVLSFIFEKFLSWFFNVYIITDERIIDVDFYSLVYREITQCKIDKVQDVTLKGGGLFRSIFNFNDIYIQTAAETQLIEFEKVPDPARVVRVLNHLIIEEEQEKIDGRVR